MNSTRYFLARLAMAFGLDLKNKRLSEAADEMHLLRLAEEILGEDIWEATEELEEVSVEYWSLRKLQKEKKKLMGFVEKLGESLDLSHEERNQILNQTNQLREKREAEKAKLIKKSEALIAERDRVIAMAQRIKRRYDASRTKMQVLADDASKREIIEEERKKLVDYKKDFVQLKEMRVKIGKKIKVFDEKIAKIDEKLLEERKKLRTEASSAYQNIGKVNRDMSKVSAQIGLIDLEVNDLYGEIGRYVSIHYEGNPVCREICKDHKNLIAQMQLLRTSIAYNHKLASMAGG